MGFSVTCIAPAMLSLSLRISCRFFVPKIFLNEVCANNLQFKIVFAYFGWQLSCCPTWCYGGCPSRWSRSRWHWTPCSKPPRPRTQSRCPWSEAEIVREICFMTINAHHSLVKKRFIFIICNILPLVGEHQV